VQARRFGAERLLARPLAGVSAAGRATSAALSDGTLIRGRAVLFASGVEWRRLDLPGIDDLLGAGVLLRGRAERGAGVHGFPGPSWWAAAIQRASGWSGSPGTRSVSRCWSAAATSARRCRSTSSIRCRLSRMLRGRVRGQVVGLEADDRLRAVIVGSGDSNRTAAVAGGCLVSSAIGGAPRTDGAAGIGLATSTAGYLVTGLDGRR